MTAKRTVSLTDQAHAYAQELVDNGRYASLSAVVQHGLELVRREEDEHRARLDAIRTDLDRRAQQEMISTEEMDERLARHWGTRDPGPGDDLA